MLARKELLDIMQSQMNDIIDQWDINGQIIETQFNFAYQHKFTTAMHIVYEIIVENNGHIPYSSEAYLSIWMAGFISSE